MAGFCTAPKPWTSERLKLMRERFGLSQNKLALQLECSVDCIRRWEGKHQKIPTSKYVLLDLFEQHFNPPDGELRNTGRAKDHPPDGAA